MNYITQAITLELRLCGACGITLIATHRFCRRCGFEQCRSDSITEQLYPELREIQSSIANAPVSTEMETLPCDPIGSHRISGSVLNLLVTRQLAVSTARISNRVAQKAVAAVIAIPIWLMIILLSPIDALQASRQVTRQMGFASDSQAEHPPGRQSFLI